MFFVKLSIALSEIASGWEIYAIEMSYVLYDSWKYIFFFILKNCNRNDLQKRTWAG